MGKSGPRPTKAVEGMPSGPWCVLGLKFNCLAVVLTLKDAVDRSGLFLVCSWSEWLTVV